MSCSSSPAQGIPIKDNDSLSAMLAAEVQADLLILMSDVDGIYNKPPWEDGAKLMHTYTSDDMNSIEFGKKSKVSGDRSLQLLHRAERKGFRIIKQFKQFRISISFPASASRSL